MVEVVNTHFFQIIMLAGNTNAFLAVDNPQAFRLHLVQKDRFELVHACIGEKQGRIIQGDNRGAMDDSMPFILEKINEGLPNFF